MNQINRSSSNPLPRFIWSYWHSGEEAAPTIVQLCLKSWHIKNPDFRLIVLNSESIHRWIDTERLGPRFPHLPIQKQANLIRCELLQKYGGVWVDANLLCLAPLSSWLPIHFKGDFLAPRLPTQDRYFGNWFLVANRESVFLNHWHEATREYFTKKRVSLTKLISFQGEKNILSRLHARRPERTLFWSHPIAIKYNPFYPYFIHHYLASRVLHSHFDDPQRDAWLSASLLRGVVAISKIQQSTHPAQTLRELHNRNIPFIKIPRPGRTKISVSEEELESAVRDFAMIGAP